MTPWQVGQMSDEDLAAMLNDRWQMVLALLTVAGGEVVIPERVLIDMPTDGVVEAHDRPQDRARVLRLSRVGRASEGQAGATSETP